MSHNLFGISGNINYEGTIQPGNVLINRLTGRIDSIAFGNRPNRSECEVPIADYGDALIEAGDFNAHSHPEQSIYVEAVDPSWDLATWCRNTIYKYSTLMTPDVIYLACCRAFSRMLLSGTTSVAVSFYCHNNRNNELDRSVISAAFNTGIRLYFGRMNYDVILDNAYAEKKNSQASYFESIEQAERNFRELLHDTAKDHGERITVAPAIHSFHANTLEAIARAIQLGDETNRIVQFHLSEDQGDVDICLNEFNLRPVEVLAKLKSEGRVKRLDHLLVSDAVWLNDREKDLVAEHGIKVVLNPRMNDRVKAGRADLASFLNRSIPVWVGTDGEASNEDLSITNETSYLQKINPSVSKKDFEQVGRHPFHSPAGPFGALEVGCMADLKVRQCDGRVSVFVGGKEVVRHNELLALNVEKEIEQPLALVQKKLGIR